MARRKQTQGNCNFCGRKLSKAGLTKHLSTCKERFNNLNDVNSKSGKEEKFYHLRIEDAWGGQFWLHLEMAGNAPMGKLDTYLRAIWLDCCGHMSEFSVGRWTEETIAMSRKADQVFRIGMEIFHMYDFGTTSETKIKVVNARKGKAISRYPITLMARNDHPEVFCVECGKPASKLCLECLYEDENQGTLCDEHAQSHPHKDYGEPMPLINSPRVGMCAYSGPAEPPY